MWLLLVPILICIVFALMIGMLFQGIFWLVGGAWPWLLIGLGAWLFWHQDGPHHRRRRDVRASTHAIVQPKPRNVAKSAPDLPIDVQVKVEQIRRKVDVLLSYADRFPPFSQ